MVRLHAKRRDTRGANGAERRRLRPSQRIRVLKKTNERCHICGGRIRGDGWHANHVVSHTHGGDHAEDNFLPAHSQCNVDRRHYLPQELRIIFKLGAWARAEVAKGTPLGVEIAERYKGKERANKRARERRQNER